MVERIYVEKKPGFDPHTRSLEAEIRDVLGVSALQHLRVLNRYDVDGADRALFDASVAGVFSEPQVDATYRTLDEALGAGPAVRAVASQDAHSQNSQDGGVAADASAEPVEPVVFAVESLPGQFDQRADSAAECMLLIGQQVRPDVRTATVYVLEGSLSKADVDAIKRYVINPVEAREAQLSSVETLEQDFPVPADVEVLEGFLDLDEAALAAFIAERGLAMDEADLAFCQCAHHYRGEDGGHVLVGPLPSHHVRHGADRYPDRRRSGTRGVRSISAGTRPVGACREAGVPDGHGHDRSEGTQGDRRADRLG